MQDKRFDSPLKDFPFRRVVKVEPTGRFEEKELWKARIGRNHWMFQLKESWSGYCLLTYRVLYVVWYVLQYCHGTRYSYRRGNG
ncbi:hypothetical protein BDV40DRAFT_253397 [Aspergillus tamarii]|uniref:Uncharacterized protein n=1 Tax=Aspergillus tamarii TaxID=41984 RepID=A0A5N6V8M3_ASPTM|nr:hypothetical protein BDV40DRAFT_253397 [Aspergillus tamarii]